MILITAAKCQNIKRDSVERYRKLPESFITKVVFFLNSSTRPTDFPVGSNLEILPYHLLGLRTNEEHLQNNFFNNTLYKQP